MIDRYAQTFKELQAKNKTAFCPFAVLGHPNKNESFKRIQEYVKAGADILELGIPFSDPVADGPAIQIADAEALNSGISTRDCLELIAKIRTITQIPIGILCYGNIVLQYDIKKFYKDLKNAGADSILIADIPLEEITLFHQAAKQNGLHQIMIVSENITLERLKKMEKFSSGFYYVVSTMGVTGERKNLNNNVKKLIRKLQKHSLLPLMIGFGISTPEHIKELQKTNADGLIVGSKLVKTPFKELPLTLKKFKDAFNSN